MSNCIETNAFHIKLIKTGFVANDKFNTIQTVKSLQYHSLDTV